MKHVPIIPGLSDEINKDILMSELMGGVYLDDVPTGKHIYMQTKNTKYVIVKVGEDWYIQGNEKYCAEPTECHIAGSTWGGSMLKLGFIGVGMYLEFGVEGHPSVLTSQIQTVEVEA